MQKTPNNEERGGGLSLATHEGPRAYLLFKNVQPAFLSLIGLPNLPRCSGNLWESARDWSPRTFHWMRSSLQRASHNPQQNLAFFGASPDPLWCGSWPSLSSRTSKLYSNAPGTEFLERFGTYETLSRAIRASKLQFTAKSRIYWSPF